MSDNIYLIIIVICVFILFRLECDYRYQDESFKHDSAKWWHIFNVVSCYDSRGGLTPVTVYRVHTLRLWSLMICQWSYVTQDDCCD